MSLVTDDVAADVVSLEDLEHFAGTWPKIGSALAPPAEAPRQPR